MARYVKIDDIQSFPIRIDRCDHKNGNIHFILGIETVMEFIDYLPQYELPETEPIDRPEFSYKEEWKSEKKDGLRGKCMNDFLYFVDLLAHRFPIHLVIYYSKVMDWCIKITKVGCAPDYPDTPHEGNDAILVNVQDADMELCFAKAHVVLKEWLSENDGGY